jgi:hypothetical protein
MANVLQKALKLLVGDDVNTDLWRIPKNRPLKPLTERELLKLESEVGSKLFGPVPAGHRREFFCLDNRTWIWHEEWIGQDKKLQTSTVRYEINDTGVLKVQEGARYSYLEGEELQNFGLSVRMYYEQVTRDVYKRDPATGKKLV